MYTHMHIIPSSTKIPINSYFSDPDTDNEGLRKAATYCFGWSREQPIQNETGQKDSMRNKHPYSNPPQKKGTEMLSHLSEIGEDKHLCQKDWI